MLQAILGGLGLGLVSGVVWAVIGFSVVTRVSTSDAEGLGFFQFVLIPVGALIGLIGGVIAVLLRTPSSIWLRLLIALAISAAISLLVNALLS